MSVGDVSQLTGKSASAVKSLLHRARNRMNRFLGASCGLVNPENICKCRSWISLAHDVEKRREHLQSIIRQANPLFDPGPSRAKLITLFRTLPYLNPPEKYLEDLETAGKKSASLP
jgi:hypothetical protein